MDPKKATKADLYEEYESVLKVMHEFMDENATLVAERDALRAENERMREIMRGCEVPAIAQETGQYDEYLTHDSNQPPADLAAAQLVATEAETGPWPVMRVDVIGWCPGLRYRPALSADGVALCSADGLEPWATHVSAAPGDECPQQHDERPRYREHLGVWHMTGLRAWPAPETHRKPGPASESLMEVWRE